MKAIVMTIAMYCALEEQSRRAGGDPARFISQ
jgi:hypothetical protein